MRLLFACSLLILLSVFAVSVSEAQTYYYNGGKISANELRRARPYKKGSFLVQSGRNRGVIWIPKHDGRGNRYLELLMEHFLQGAKEIQNYSPIQVGTIVGGSHGIASVLSLLMDLEARNMLGVTHEQGEKINDLFSAFREQVHNRVLELQRQNPRATTFQAVLSRMGEIERLSMMLEPQLELILSKEQVLRAKEMVFQLYGGFHSPVVDLGILSLFDLSKEQREKLELIAEDANQKRDKIFTAKNSGQLGVDDMQAFDAAMADAATIVSRKVRETLTPEQVERGNELMKGAEEIKTKLGLTKD